MKNLLRALAPILALVPCTISASEPHTHSFAVPSNGVGAMCPCALENPEMLPPEYFAYLMEQKEASAETTSIDKNSLTLVPVSIDPLGADPATPWYIHISSLNVRDQPTTVGSNVIGSVTAGMQINGGTYYIVQESDQEWLGFPFNATTGYIHRLGFSRIHPANADMIAQFTNLPFGEEIVNRWWGIPLSYEANDLVTIPNPYTNNVSGRVYQLRAEAAASVMDMIDLAQSQGIFFYVASPYRSGAAQQTIYVNNTQNNLAQRSSAPPGHSEHQLATTVDFSNGRPGSFLNNTDPRYIWLVNNAPSFGWRQSYTATNVDETGYIEEPWHWRYIGVSQVNDWMMMD